MPLSQPFDLDNFYFLSYMVLLCLPLESLDQKTVNLLACLEFSASYYDTRQLELSTIYYLSEPSPIGTFSKYIFDNIDVATLDGLNTFHSIGGIKCITPAWVLPSVEKIKRLKTPPSAVEVGKLGVLELQEFENLNKKALKDIVV